MVDIGPASSIPEITFTTWTQLWSVADADFSWNHAVIDEIGGVVYTMGNAGGGGTTSALKARKLTDGSIVSAPLDALPTSGSINVGYITQYSIRHVYLVSKVALVTGEAGWMVSRGGTRVFTKTPPGVTTDNALAVIAISPTGQYIVTIEGATRNQIKVHQGS